MSGLVRAARRRHRHDDGGFALMAVLAAIGTFSIIVVALLSLLLSDMRVKALARDVGAVQRAVDGALEAAVNQVRMSDGSMGVLGQPCDPVGAAGDPSVVIDGHRVEVECTPLPPAGSTPPYPSSTGRALTLGGGYTGPVTALARIGIENGLNTDALLQFDNSLRSSAPGLVHVGGQPLQVVGDVAVRQWTAAYNQVGSPALRVRGRYAQGQLGIGGGAGIDWFGSWIPLTPNCGILDPAFPLVPQPQMQVHASPMQCGNAADPAMADPYAAVAPPRNWSTLPAPQVVPATCPAGAVVTLAPGHYDRVATETLNRWFNGSSCPTASTFWFTPGDYYFDVSVGVGLDRGALVFDNPNANWVFGAPRGWDPAAGPATAAQFPNACNTTGGGVTVTLSGRSTLRHKQGLVAMCGTRTPDGSQRVMIEQQTLGDQLRWAGEPVAATSAVVNGNPAFTNPNDATATSAAPVEPAFPNPPYGARYDGSEGAAAAQRRSATVACGAGVLACNPSITFTGFTNPDEPALGGDASNLRLMIRGVPNAYVSSPNEPLLCPTGAIGLDCSATAVRLDFDGRSCLLYQSDVARGLYAFNLDPCRAQGLTDATQLDGATVTVIPQLRKRNEGFCDFWWFGTYYPCHGMEFSIDYVWLEAVINQPSAPSALSTLVNTTPPNGTPGNAIWFFGPVHAPRSEVEVNWQGGASLSPIFAGGLVARALASWPTSGNPSIGVIAAPDMRSSERTVLVRARIDGRLRGSAVVTVVDSDAAGAASQPGRLMSVDDWKLCNEPWPTTPNATCSS